MKREVILLSLVALLGCALARGPGCPIFCSLGNACWPTEQIIRQFRDSMSYSGGVILPQDAMYSHLVIMKNTYWTRYPGIIVRAQTVGDVQKAVLFAAQHSMRLTIYSSGHEYTGKSTAHGSLQINMADMQGIWFNMNDPASDTGSSVTVETGNTWAGIYAQVDMYNKVIVGGSAQTVTPGGYTLGGGISPLSRSLGLAIDNLLAVSMVLGDGRIVNCTETGTNIIEVNGRVQQTADTDLFWAIRGGGGGTFGVVITYTFKLHNPPPQLVQYLTVYPMHEGNNQTTGRQVMEFVNSMAKTLPPQWGGYITYRSFESQFRPNTKAVIILSLLHYGPWNAPSFAPIFDLVNLLPGKKWFSEFTNHSSFWAYEQNVTDPLYFRSYVTNSLLSPAKLTTQLIDFYVDTIMNPPNNVTSAYCLGTLLGGRISDNRNLKTAINPHLRDAIISSTCSLAWGFASLDSQNYAAGKRLTLGHYQHSVAVYINEASYNLPNWKTDFFGANYDRLLQIKQKWDPSKMFYCRHCVGEDSSCAETSQTGLGGPVIDETGTVVSDGLGNDVIITDHADSILGPSLLTMIFVTVVLQRLS